MDVRSPTISAEGELCEEEEGEREQADDRIETAAAEHRGMLTSISTNMEPAPIMEPIGALISCKSHAGAREYKGARRLANTLTPCGMRDTRTNTGNTTSFSGAWPLTMAAAFAV